MAFSTSRGGFHILQQPPQTTLLKKYTNLAPQAFPSGTLHYGAAVYIDDDGSLNLAKADIWQNAQTVGVVQGGYTANGMWSVEVVYQGEIQFPSGATSSLLKFPLVTGDTYYLSTGLSGGLTAGVPSTSTVVQPMMIATDSYSGIVVNGLPAASVLLGNTQVSIFSPVGTIVPFAGTPDKVPGNYLLCVGDSFPKGTTSSDTYNDLYNAIGEKYSVLGVVLSGTTGSTGYIRFDGSVDDSHLIPTGNPGSKKNHSIANNQIYKMVWGSKEAVVEVYSSTGSTTDATFKFLKGITGWATGASSFNDLPEGTEVYVKSLKSLEVSGYTSDYFFVPDLRGRTIMGSGKGRGLSTHVLGEMGGEETHTLSLSEIPSHRHEIPIRSSISGGYTPPGPQQQTIGSGITASGVNSVITNQYQANKAVSDLTGGSQAHQNLPPYLSTNWIIRYKSNKGNPGVEVGPQGAAGPAGITGTPGVTGPTGSTGFSLGTLSYRYGTNTTVPQGYFWYDTASRIFYINEIQPTGTTVTNLSSFFGTWGYSSSAIRGTLYIRDAVTLDTIRILGITQAGSKIGQVYSFPATVDLGGNLNFNTPRLYNIIWVPTGNMGASGRSITGADGPRGSTGVTGERGSTGVTGSCECDLSSWGDALYKTVYLAPSGRMDGSVSTGSVFPLNLSSIQEEPSSFNYWYNTAEKQSSHIKTNPINLSRTLYSNWGTNVSLKNTCGGVGCTAGGIGNMTYMSSAAAAQSLEKIAGVEIVLDRGNYTISRPIYAENGNYHLCAGDNTYLQIDPESLSASTVGLTSTIEIMSAVDNVAVGDYLSLTPETFIMGGSGFSGPDTRMNPMSLCGLYIVTGIDTELGKVTALGRMVNGISGSPLFTGMIGNTNLGFYNVYKTSLTINNTTGFVVDSNSTLTLGKRGDGSGNPFVIVYSGSDANRFDSKAIVCDGGKVNLAKGMGVYGTPINGSAVYAVGGRVVSDGIVVSRNAVGVYAENASVVLRGSVLSQNTSALVANKNSTIYIDAAGLTYDYNIIANNRTAIMVNGADIEVSDPNFRLLSASGQQGILASNSSSVRIVPSTTGSYSSVIDGYPVTGGNLQTDPQSVILASKNSTYVIVANRVGGTVYDNLAIGSITGSTGAVFGFVGNSVAYPNQDLVI